MIYIRVKDPATGHEFDVPENSVLLRKGLVRRVRKDHYPPATVRRATKYHPKKLAARPGLTRTQTTAAVAATEATTKESQDG